ncbi:YgaP family membrane protein [Flavobacterium pallidum]|uniref:Inner membrane protein YgaP-like transmembrane domain-containing protein n=1 Tax=Flavobacterium pallidum TaxID=2172098 RepID=A0A2S1SII5_9FLAO|nr:DUF2892 domain-containing protein [Flavobacterium pallidum]AWI26210.1 hypothetical protein HYN49_10025 [Flavobacterium pallidum]
MKKNINTSDKYIRFIAAVLFLLLSLIAWDDRFVGITSGVIGIYLLLTVVFGSCVVYRFP